MSAYVKANNVNCKNIAQCFQQLHEREKVAFIVSRNHAKYFESNEQLPVYCFAKSHSFKRVTRTFIVTRSQRNIMKRINGFIRRTMETGLMQKWHADSSRIQVDKWDEHVVLLRVEHIFIALMILFGGQTIAFSCFISERATFKNILRNTKSARKWKALHRYLLSTERIFCLPERNSE